MQETKNWVILIVPSGSNSLHINNVMFHRPHKKSGEAKKLEKSHARDKKLGHFDCSLRQ